MEGEHTPTIIQLIRSMDLAVIQLKDSHLFFIFPNKKWFVFFFSGGFGLVPFNVQLSMYKYPKIIIGGATYTNFHSRMICKLDFFINARIVFLIAEVIPAILCNCLCGIGVIAHLKRGMIWRHNDLHECRWWSWRSVVAFVLPRMERIDFRMVMLSEGWVISG